MGVLGKPIESGGDSNWVGMLVALEPETTGGARRPKEFWKEMVELGFSTPPVQHGWISQSDSDTWLEFPDPHYRIEHSLASGMAMLTPMR